MPKDYDNFILLKEEDAQFILRILDNAEFEGNLQGFKDAVRVSKNIKKQLADNQKAKA